MIEARVRAVLFDEGERNAVLGKHTDAQSSARVMQGGGLMRPRSRVAVRQKGERERYEPDMLGGFGERHGAAHQRAPRRRASSTSPCGDLTTTTSFPAAAQAAPTCATALAFAPFLSLSPRSVKQSRA